MLMLIIEVWYVSGEKEIQTLKNLSQKQINGIISFGSEYLRSLNNPEQWNRVKITVEEDK